MINNNILAGMLAFTGVANFIYFYLTYYKGEVSKQSVVDNSTQCSENESVLYTNYYFEDAYTVPDQNQNTSSKSEFKKLFSSL